MDNLHYLPLFPTFYFRQVKNHEKKASRALCHGIQDGLNLEESRPTICGGVRTGQALSLRVRPLWLYGYGTRRFAVGVYKNRLVARFLRSGKKWGYRYLDLA